MQLNFWRQKKLSRQIKKEKRNYQTFRSTLHKFFVLYYPTWQSIITIVIVFLPFIVFSHIKVTCLADVFPQIPDSLCLEVDDVFINKEDSHFQNIIAIHAGVSAILFALIIFIAESMRDSERTDKARVLLKKSFLYPVVVWDILVFFIYGWGEINYFALIPIFLISILTLWSLSNLIIMLLNRYKFNIELEKLINSRIKQSIDLAINERIGKNIFHNFLSKKSIKLSYMPMAFMYKENYLTFDSDKLGEVTDIDLTGLEDISNLIDEIALSKGYSFEPDDKIPSLGDFSSAATQLIPYTKLEQNTKRYILKGFHDIVTEKNPGLLWVDKKIVTENQDIRKLKSLVRKTFNIGRTDSFSKEFQYELSEVKDSLISAIERKHISKVKDLTKLYLEVADGFLEQLSDFNITYSFKQARSEKVSLGGGWDEIKWLSTDIRDLISSSLRGEDISVIKEVASLPFRIAWRAIYRDDHYLFQEFVVFSIIYYREGIECKDEKIGEFLIDRSLRYLKEISDYHLSPIITREKEDLANLRSLIDYSIFLLIVYQNIIKLAYENNDQGTFSLIMSEIKQLLVDIKDEDVFYEEDFILYRLSNNQISQNEKNELEQKIKTINDLKDIYDEFSQRKQQLFFGLASFSLRNCLKSKDSSSTCDYYKICLGFLPQDLIEFSKHFIHSHSWDVEEFWNWTFWEEMKEGAHFQTSSILSNMEVLYIVHSVNILSKMKEVDLDTIELPVNQEFANLCRKGGALEGIIKDIEEKNDRYIEVITSENVKLLPTLDKLLKSVDEKQTEANLSNKKRKSISIEKVNEFKDEFVTSYYQHSKIKKILTRYQAFKPHTSEMKDLDRFGINRVDDKAVFFDDWHEIFSGWGTHYGREMAIGENEFLLNKIEAICNNIEKDDIALKVSSMSPNEILMISVNVAPILFSKAFDDLPLVPNFNADNRSNIEPRVTFDFNDVKIPFYQVNVKHAHGYVLLLNRKKLGMLNQLSPLNETDDTSNKKDIFIFDIEAFSENPNMLNEFLDTPPGWLKDKGNIQEKQDYLLSLVKIAIFERFEYLDENFEGYKIDVPRPQ